MITLLVLRSVMEATRLKRATVYLRIQQGRFPRPIKQGERLSVWPSHEVEAINRATIAGASPDALRALVADLERQRTAIAAQTKEPPNPLAKRSERLSIERKRRDMTDSIVAPSAQALARLSNIPSDLRQGVKWIVWRKEDRGGEKPAKIPYSPIFCTLASVSDPATWGSFEAAEEMYRTGRYDGIGRVFTKDDEYCFIDLDDTKGDTAALERQRAIVRECRSYTERSPSGNGVHVICKATIPHGKRRGTIELYDSDRYATFTGDVFEDHFEVAECHAFVNALWHSLGGSERVAEAVSGFQRPATEADEEIYRRAASVAGGDIFVRLWNGDASAVEGQDKSGSAVDQALVNKLQKRTKDPAQIERMWLASPQGQRSKTQDRKDYRDRTIARAFDQEVAPLDISSLQAKLGHRLIMSASKS